MSRGAPPLPELPVSSAMPALCQALARDGRALLAAPPGSGKTTLAPLHLLQQDWLRAQRIILLEPRRVAARAAAARMASLLGERVGETVGYQIRFERRISARTRIEVLTEGLLARRLQADPELPGVGLVIFDEFHERSLDADLALALTLDVRANLRPELRVLVMSATLDSARVAALLDDAEIVQSGGRMFPVDIHYAPPRNGVSLDAAVADGVLTALAQGDGDVLAFLPGAREIRAAQRGLEARSTAAVYPLYGELSSAEQDAALQPQRSGRRKVILATNIAQTSLTVEGVTTVVDSGWARVARFDFGAGSNRLDTLRISRAAAEQRAGRAGRLGPGVAYRLWSRDQQAQLAAHDTPEMLAADLSRLALDLADWGIQDPAQLALLDLPPAPAWRYARELLEALGALDAQGRISAHGRALARLPTAPRRAHMLLAARDWQLGPTAAWLAAVLDERAAGAGSDVGAWLQDVRRGRGEPAQLRRIREAARQLLRLLDVNGGAGNGDRAGAGEGDFVELHDDAAGRLLALAYPERLARRREQSRDAREVSFLCADGGEARLPQQDVLARAPWLAIAHWEVTADGARRVRLAAALDAETVLRDQAERIVERNEITWDAGTAAVVAERQRRLGAIVLERRPLREGAAREAAQTAIRAALLQGLRSLGIAALPWSEAARQWQARVLSLRAWRREEAWPDVSDDNLVATYEDWLAPWLDGVTRRDHLARLDLPSIFNALLDYAQQQALARLAPVQLAVPSGSRIAVEYAADGAPPVLAVKLQELFGLTTTPTVNDGRTPVALHLLSPARRPIQVTQDLAGFWARTYPEVKKELKGRYPKHPWPDDPLSAPPTAKTRRAAGL